MVGGAVAFKSPQRVQETVGPERDLIVSKSVEFQDVRQVPAFAASSATMASAMRSEHVLLESMSMGRSSLQMGGLASSRTRTYGG